MPTASALISALQRHQTEFGVGRPPIKLMVSMFNSLVALYDQSQTNMSGGHLPQPYAAFRQAIESELSHEPKVVDYAHELGYSARTISRACQKVTGQTAKAVLNERLVLEAKRLLVHTDLSAAAISHRLGFTEPTNFTKFFIRNAGATPSAFRSSER